LSAGGAQARDGVGEGRANEVEATRAALWPQLGEAPGQFFQNAVSSGSGETAQPTGPGGTTRSQVVLGYGLVKSGTSHFFNAPLGVNPLGNFVNAVDIWCGLALRDPLEEGPQHPRHSKYRWRQTVSQKAFQKVGTHWQQVFHSTGSEEDDPLPNFQDNDPATRMLWMYDSPGWPTPPVHPGTRTLPLGGGVMSSGQATEVVVKMMMRAWVEGQGTDGGWERVSSDDGMEWCSVQWLKRATPNSNWATTPGAQITAGSQAKSEFAKSPDDT
jgi:hypothetical protein